MTGTTEQVKTLAKQLADALTTDKRADGKPYTHLKDGSPAWMTDVIHAVHAGKMPDDTVYEFIDRCACAIADYDDPQDAIAEIEADSYTTDLTGWLHERCDHVYYLSEVLDEYGSDVKDGFQLLQLAQKRQLDEVGAALISELENLELDEDDAV
jgi:hypothetical protein